MGSLLGPKCFLSSAFFIISILSVYGIVGSVYNYLQIGQFHDIGEWPFNIRPLFFSFILIQSLFPLVGFFALVAACKRHPLFLLGSASFLLAIFVSACVFGAVSFHVSSQEILGSYYKTFRNEVNMTKVSEWMNDMQLEHRCCGVYSYMDWYTLDNDNSITVENKIPSSCCRRDSLPYNKDCGAGILSKDSKENAETQIYSEGCGLKLANTRKQLLERLSIEMCVCGGVSLCVAIFLYIGVTKFFLDGRNSCSSSSNHQGESDQPSVTTSGKEGGSGTYMNDENNNVRKFGSNFRTRMNKKPLEKRYKNSGRGQFASIHSQSKFGRSSRGVIGDISKSKSFIIGDAHSMLLAPISEERDPDLLKKNVDMLWYQSLDKNMSTLSTTPNDISSMLLPGMGFLNKKTGLGCEEITGININEDETRNRSTVYTLVSERPFAPSSFHNCSSPYENNNNAAKLTVACEPLGTGQTSPTTCSNCKQQRPSYKVSEEISEEKKLDATNVEEVGPGNGQASSESKVKEQQKTVEESSSKYNNNPTSSVRTVRSSALSTIDEESESSKGTPMHAKGSSPASGSLTPDITPKQTQTELFSPLDKENATSCAVEVNRTNNNNNNFTLVDAVVDVAPDSSS